ncbi:MAG: hypothetical protein OXN83_04110 [Oligoflexia bacterium]|nr:hypothetical protein [Oligoflexia bacterium]
MKQVLKVLSFIFYLIPKWLASAVKKEIVDMRLEITSIREHLISKGIMPPMYYRTTSPRQTTEEGHKLLQKLNVHDYLKSNCNLLTNEELKNKTDVQIFSECLKWSKEKGTEKVMEIRLNTTLLKEQAQELLALAIMEKIKAK